MSKREVFRSFLYLRLRRATRANTVLERMAVETGNVKCLRLRRKGSLGSVRAKIYRESDICFTPTSYPGAASSCDSNRDRRGALTPKAAGEFAARLRIGSVM